MNEFDCEGILDHLRDLMLKVNLNIIDDIASMEASTRDLPMERLETYLRIVISFLKENSGGTARDVNLQLADSLELKDGGKFEGVMVCFNKNERELYRMEQEEYKISAMPDYTPVINKLEDIIYKIKNELENPKNGFDHEVSR